MSQFDPVGFGDEPLRQHSGYRAPEDDFYCLRFAVWYPSLDCALRTRFRTCSGCFDCEQGRFNLKRHSAEIASLRAFPFRRV